MKEQRPATEDNWGVKVVSLDGAVRKGLCGGRKEGRTQKGTYLTACWAEGPMSGKALWRGKHLVGSKL